MAAGKQADAGPFYLSLLIAVLLVPAALGSSLTIFNDGDVSWHIATGQWILDHRAIPATDPFSFTWAGKPWVPIEWLAEVLYAAAYRLAAYSGVAALVTIALMGLHAAVFANASRWTRRSLLAIALMDLVLIPTMLARPHLLTWPLLAWWVWLMLRAREADRAPPLPAARLHCNIRSTAGQSMQPGQRVQRQRQHPAEQQPAHPMKPRPFPGDQGQSHGEDPEEHRR
jgi:hypothetical protein